jgi:hypothetical protein
MAKHLPVEWLKLGDATTLVAPPEPNLSDGLGYVRDPICIRPLGRVGHDHHINSVSERANSAPDFVSHLHCVARMEQKWNIARAKFAAMTNEQLWWLAVILLLGWVLHVSFNVGIRLMAG